MAIGLNVKFFSVISNEHLYLLGLGPELVPAVGEMLTSYSMEMASCLIVRRETASSRPLIGENVFVDRMKLKRLFIIIIIYLFKSLIVCNFFPVGLRVF